MFAKCNWFETLFMYYIAMCLYLSSTVALSIHCFACHSSSSWAGCQKNLTMHNCGKGDWVCLTQVLNITGSVSYRKSCGERSQCDPDTCHTHYTTCEIHCCCEDYCNAGIPGEGEVSDVVGLKASIFSLSSYITVVLVLQIFTL